MSKRQIILLVFVAFLITFQQIFAEKSSGSSYSYTDSGTRALYELLEANSFNITRHLQPVSSLPETTGNLLVLVSPQKPVPKESLEKWLKAGNTVFLASKSSSLFDSLREDEKSEPLESSSFYCSARFGNVCNNVFELEVPESLLPPTPDTTTVVSVNDVSLLNYTPVGSGELYYSEFPMLFSNLFIDKKDNAALAYQLISSYKNIYFGEFYHGYVQPTREQFLKQSSSLKILSILSIILLSIFILSRAVRFAPPAWTPSDTIAASTEFSQALGLLYEHHRADEALNNYVEAWKIRCAKNFGLAYLKDNDTFIHQLESKGIITAKERTQLGALLKTSQGRAQITVLEKILDDRP